MRLNKVILLTTLIAMVPLATACISSVEFDELTQEMEAARSDIEALQTRYDDLSKQYDELAGNLALAESLIDDLQVGSGEALMQAIELLEKIDKDESQFLVPVVFAAQDIQAGTVIEKDMMVIVPFPAEFLVETMMTDFEVVAGRVARIDILRGMVITQGLLEAP